MKSFLSSNITKRIILNRALIFNFSQFKNKFQKFQQTNYDKLTDLYHDLNNFQKTLQYVDKLKYRKSVEILQKKIRKIIKKQTNSDNYNSQDSSNFNQLLKQFNTSISYEFFYQFQNVKYKPIDQLMVLNKIQLPQLFFIVCGKNSTFLKSLDLINQNILSNPAVNQSLYQKIKQRCSYFEQQLSLNVFEQYQQTTKQVQQLLNMEKSNALRNLKGVKKSDKIFSKDFKFIVKKNLTPQQNYFATQIAKILTKYNFSTDKTKLFSVKSLTNEGYRSLTPASLKNHLYVLAYNKYQIPQFNDNLFKIFDIFAEQNQKFPTPQFIGKFDYMNSLLFYILSNKIQNYELIKSILMKIVQGLANYQKIYQKENIKQKIQNLMASVDSIDRQLFAIMLQIIKLKYQLDPQSIKQQINPKNTQYLKHQSIIKYLPKISSNSHQDFQRYLKKKQYKFEISSYQNSQQGSVSTLTSDKIYIIEDKKFICLHLTRFNKTTQKPNGVGQLILQYFKFLGVQIKIINPLVVNSFQKWGQKQQYFKSKLKGINQPQSTKKKRYDI